MNKLVYLRFLILEYIKPKYGEKAKQCYIDTDSFVVYKKQMISIKTLQNILRKGLILQNMN